MNLPSSLRSRGWTWFLASQFLIAPIWAWEDTPLTWEADGSISGLPDGFARASLHVRFSPGVRARVAAVQLELASKRLTLPKCLLKHFRGNREEDVMVVGSWNQGMEPALVLYFALPRGESGLEGATVSFGLRDAELNGLYTLTVRGGRELELSASCRADVKEGTIESSL